MENSIPTISSDQYESIKRLKYSFVDNAIAYPTGIEADKLSVFLRDYVERLNAKRKRKAEK